MDYNLALKLVENGYKQNNSSYGYYEHKDRGIEVQYCDEAYGKFICDIPELSDLIEACGNEFDSLEKRGDSFFAFGSSKDSVGLKINPFLGMGKTPEEALSYLWININS